MVSVLGRLYPAGSWASMYKAASRVGVASSWGRGYFMKGAPWPPLRVWRSHLGRNRLTRRCDRAEGLLIMTGVFLALICIPICATVGSEQTARAVERAHQEKGTRFPATAVTLEPAVAPVSSVASEAGRPVRVAVGATWPGGDGTARVGRLPVRTGTPRGAAQPIWLDESGNLVNAPLQASEAVSIGILLGTAAWLAVLGTLAGALWVAHLLFDRRRYAQWTREWEQFEPRSSRS